MGYELLVGHGEELVVQRGEIEGRGSHDGRLCNAIDRIDECNEQEEYKKRNEYDKHNECNE